MALNPLWLQNIDYPARIDRAVYDAIWTEGVIGVSDYTVTQDTSPNMTVRVQPGSAVVTGDDQAYQGKYLVRMESTETGLVIGAAPGIGQRNDLIVLKVRDQNAGVGTNNDAVFQVIAGTPSALPVDPTVPDSALVLARVRVPAGTSAISNSLIDDLRVRATSNYDAVPDSGVTSGKIANGTIVDVDISASAAISLSKIQTGSLPSGIKVSTANFANNVIPTDATFTIPGTLAVGQTNVRYYVETARTIQYVVASVSTAPTGASLIFALKKNNVQIGTTTITASNFYAVSSAPSVTSLAAGDYLTFDVSQIGSGTPGSNAVLRVVFA